MYLLGKLYKWQLLVIPPKHQKVLIMLEDVEDLGHVEEKETIETEVVIFTLFSLVEVITSVQLPPLLPFQHC